MPFTIVTASQPSLTRQIRPQKSSQPPSLSPNTYVVDMNMDRRMTAAAAAVLPTAILTATLLITCPTLPAQAWWDGESSAVGSCPLGEAGSECRVKTLAKDKTLLSSYNSLAGTDAGKIAAPAPAGSSAGSSNSGTGSLNPKYVSDTRSISDKLRTLFMVDPSDPQRIALVKEMKVEGPKWVSKYARGGSVSTPSGRKMYVVVDAVQGWVTSNGLAPLPANKAGKLLINLDEVAALINEGK